MKAADLDHAVIHEGACTIEGPGRLAASASRTTSSALAADTTDATITTDTTGTPGCRADGCDGKARRENTKEVRVTLPTAPPGPCRALAPVPAIGSGGARTANKTVSPRIAKRLSSVEGSRINKLGTQRSRHGHRDQGRCYRQDTTIAHCFSPWLLGSCPNGLWSRIQIQLPRFHRTWRARGQARRSF